MLVILLSRRRYPGDIEETLEILINNKKYRYITNSIIIDTFKNMLRYDKKGFKALNFLKKHSECKGEIKNV